MRVCVVCAIVYVWVCVCGCAQLLQANESEIRALGAELERARHATTQATQLAERATADLAAQSAVSGRLCVQRIRVLWAVHPYS